MRITPILVALAFGIVTTSTTSPSDPESAADIALDKSMATMHSEMKKVRYSGCPDADFALMMVPHHQGAIEMAKVELQFGTDPRLRRLAQEILVTQQSEIEMMNLALKAYDLSSGSQKHKKGCTQ
jgi:uncharacterized protein (DUF305 family)